MTATKNYLPQAKNGRVIFSSMQGEFNKDWTPLSPVKYTKKILIIPTG